MRWPVIECDTLDSTNSEAQRRITAGQMEGTWITARHQAAGRGRSGRNWQSLDGNLFASLLLPLHCPPTVLHHLSLVSGLALRNALRNCSKASGIELEPRLKWPNDVLIDDAKVAGILIESSIVGDRALAIVGIGVNIQAAPQLSDRKTTSLADYEVNTTPRELLAFLDEALSVEIKRWDSGPGFHLIREDWLRHSFDVGHPISINTAKARVEGEFAGLDKDGALLIRTTEGNIEYFHFGDVAVGGEAAMSANGETNNA